MRHTVAISDIHLCELERTDGLWMRYRQEPFSPDRDLAAMLDALRARVRETRGDELCLVLNGDVFDFDAPRVVDGQSFFHDLPRTAEHALPAMRSMIADHPVFMAALGRVLAEGHEVVFVSGNHDVLLTLPEVRAELAARLVEAAVAEGLASRGAERLAQQIIFRGWFHVTPDGIVVEHGHQYDRYCCYRTPMAPFGPQPGEVQPTMGSLCTRNLLSRMGYFNPHVDGSFMLSALGYLVHWAKYYLFSRRSLAIAYARGAAHTVAELIRRRFPGDRGRSRHNVRAAAEETGAPLRAVARHARLFATTAEDRLGTVLREFWVDRMALGGLTVLGAVLFFALARGPMMLGAILAPALFVTYELSVPKTELDETWRRVQRVARRVARVHRARAVVFGHTHKAEGAWEGGVFFGNTGSWSPAFEDLECTRPISRERPLVWLRSEAGVLTGGLVSWRDGAFVESPATR
jgi:UDP-2,3-diacylglucosamine pyrophosphatase LpxH